MNTGMHVYFMPAPQLVGKVSQSWVFFFFRFLPFEMEEVLRNMGREISEIGTANSPSPLSLTLLLLTDSDDAEI